MRLLAFCQSSFTTALQLHQLRTRNVIVAKLAGKKKVVNPADTQYIYDNCVLCHLSKRVMSHIEVWNILG